MPFVQAIGGKLRDRAIELERKSRETGVTWDIAYRHGFMEALRSLLPSETIGMLICDIDCALDDEPLYTDGLPRVVRADKPAGDR
jgi:hypothetical protein